MNIFVLDKCSRTNVRMYCDQHIVKMIIETAQLLCSVHHVLHVNSDIPYKLSHKNHPCALWARQSLDNYNWLVRLGQEMCAEYHVRYNKTHKSASVIDWAYHNVPMLDSTGLTPFPQCMPSEYQCSDPIEAYRAYYCYKYMYSLRSRRTRMRYTHRPIPDFLLKEMRHEYK